MTIVMYRCTGCGRQTPVSGGPERRCDRKRFSAGVACPGVMLTQEEFDAAGAAGRIGGREGMQAVLDELWARYGRVPLSQRSVGLSWQEYNALVNTE